MYLGITGVVHWEFFLVSNHLLLVSEFPFLSCLITWTLS